MKHATNSRARIALQFFLAFATLAAVGSTATAQLDSSQVGCANCLWRADLARTGVWSYELDPTLPQKRVPAVTAAELETMRSTLRTIADFLHATPLLATPKGIDAHARGRIDHGCVYNKYLCRWTPLPAYVQVRIDMHLVNATTGAHEMQAQESPRIHVVVNEPGELYLTGLKRLDGNGLFDENGNEMVILPWKIADIGGQVLYDNQIIVLARNSRPVWIPVSREGYLRGVIKGMRQRAIDSPTEKMGFDMVIKEFTTELDAMSAAERTSRAFVNCQCGNASGLAPEGAAGATPIAIFNPAYFDASLPRTTVQLLTLRFPLPLGDPNPLDPRTNDLRRIRHYELQHAIDYAGLRALIR